MSHCRFPITIQVGADFLVIHYLSNPYQTPPSDQRVQTNAIVEQQQCPPEEPECDSSLGLGTGQDEQQTSGEEEEQSDQGDQDL